MYRKIRDDIDVRDLKTDGRIKVSLTKLNYDPKSENVPTK